MKQENKSDREPRFWIPDKIPFYMNIWLFKTFHIDGKGRYVSIQPYPSGVTLRIVLSGEWHISMCGKEYKAGRGDIFYASPSQKITFMQKQPGLHWEWLEIQFNGPGADEFVGQFGLSFHNAAISPLEPEKCIDLFHRLHETMGCENRKPSTLLSQLFELIDATGREPICSDGKSLRGYRTLIAKALDYIDTSPRLNCNVSELAERLHIDRTTLNRAFKAETGLTAHETIDKHRYMRARELLNASDMSLASIATRTGFSDAKYFISWFRKKSGLSPGKWRNGN